MFRQFGQFINKMLFCLRDNAITAMCKAHKQHNDQIKEMLSCTLVLLLTEMTKTRHNNESP